MNLPPEDKIGTLDDIQTFLDKTPAGMFLLDRRGRVHLSNDMVEQLSHRTKEEITGQSFGEALGCIHILDHRDGCGYGSICGDCFLLIGVKQALKTQQPVEAVEGPLAIGIRGQGVIRPQLKAEITPLNLQKRLYLLMSVVETSGEAQ